MWMSGAEHDRRDDQSSRRSFCLLNCTRLPRENAGRKSREGKKAAKKDAKNADTKTLRHEGKTKFEISDL
jgi:hypothetical protein